MTTMHSEQDVLMQEDVAAQRENQGPGQSQSQIADIKQQTRGMLDENKDRLVQRLSKVEHAIRDVSDRLRNQQEEDLADYGHRAADRIAKLGGRLQSRDAASLLKEAEDFGRRNPWVVVSVALLAGLVLGRLLKNQ